MGSALTIVFILACFITTYVKLNKLDEKVEKTMQELKEEQNKRGDN